MRVGDGFRVAQFGCHGVVNLLLKRFESGSSVVRSRERKPTGEVLNSGGSAVGNELHRIIKLLILEGDPRHESKKMLYVSNARPIDKLRLRHEERPEELRNHAR
ncbi:unnamed protein product [Dovyalis caffra]|uniref:Uncharacterized protein n=1 Tax=Dovyalis caffra TaxID=77055 RepID=A0AAV1R4E0_9ROSI|nr:unnamed protein product [Dovyalis caffra]